MYCGNGTRRKGVKDSEKQTKESVWENEATAIQQWWESSAEAEMKRIPWEAAVVEIDIAFLEGTKLALLLILLDGIQSFLGRNLKLFPVPTLSKQSEGALLWDT
jgi:hypothetical protein